jgi:spermidine synthase
MPTSTRRHDSYCYLIFFVAGIPALMYQVVWQRVLTLYFGVDIYSTSVTVATFMLGLGLGSLLGGWLADHVKRPAAYYAWTEILIGTFGLVSLQLFSMVGQWLAGSSLAILVLANFLLLLVPTTLMGMTLPLMSRVVITSNKAIGHHLARLYGLNTLGAAIGALLSSYLLVGLFGLDGATRIAALTNVILAIVMYFFVARQRTDETHHEETSSFEYDAKVKAQDHERGNLGYRQVLVFAFLSGFIALSYELVWYRVLGVILHQTVYVFGTILFFYLIGNALGSLIAQRRIDQEGGSRRFALCQLGIAAFSFVSFSLLGHLSWLPGLRHIISASFFTTFHPALELVSGTVNIFSLYSLLDMGLWPILILVIPALLMGYGFPNLMREGTRRVERLGRSIGGIYFANIIGSTLGGLITGFLAIQFFGTERTLQATIILGGSIPIVLFSGMRKSDDAMPQARRTRTRLWWYVSVALVTVTVFMFPGPSKIIRAIHLADYDVVDYLGVEDRTGVVALRQQHAIIAFEQEKTVLGEQRLYIDGGAHGGFNPSQAIPSRDSAVEISLAAHPAPRRILSIGLGDGQMCMSAALWNGVEELVIVELNNSLRDVVSHTAEGKALFESKKVTYIVDDGRRWLLANPNEKFDFIMMWPLHAAHAYSGNLFSREFMEILSKHLNVGGLIFLKTVDLYSTPKTLSSVFPYMIRLGKVSYLSSFTDFQINPTLLPIPTEEVLTQITADRDMILAQTRDAPINKDFHPNSEYYITYPFTWAMEKQASAYEVKDVNYFRRLISPSDRRVISSPNRK